MQVWGVKPTKLIGATFALNAGADRCRHRGKAEGVSNQSTCWKFAALSRIICFSSPTCLSCSSLAALSLASSSCKKSHLMTFPLSSIHVNDKTYD